MTLNNQHSRRIKIKKDSIQIEMTKIEKTTKENDMKNFVPKPNYANLIAAFDRRNQLSLNAHGHQCFPMELPSYCVLQAALPRARNQERKPLEASSLPLLNFRSHAHFFFDFLRS